MNQNCDQRLDINNRLKTVFRSNILKGIEIVDIQCNIDPISFRSNSKQRRKKRKRRLEDIEEQARLYQQNFMERFMEKKVKPVLQKGLYNTIIQNTDVGIRLPSELNMFEPLVNGTVFLMTFMKDWQFTFRAQTFSRLTNPNKSSTKHTPHIDIVSKFLLNGLNSLSFKDIVFILQTSFVIVATVGSLSDTDMFNFVKYYVKDFIPFIHSHMSDVLPSLLTEEHQIAIVRLLVAQGGKTIIPSIAEVSKSYYTSLKEHFGKQQQK